LRGEESFALKSHISNPAENKYSSKGTAMAVFKVPRFKNTPSKVQNGVLT
jgi:hypothetical protein